MQKIQMFLSKTKNQQFKIQHTCKMVDCSPHFNLVFYYVFLRLAVHKPHCFRWPHLIYSYKWFIHISHNTCYTEKLLSLHPFLVEIPLSDYLISKVVKIATFNFFVHISCFANFSYNFWITHFRSSLSIYSPANRDSSIFGHHWCTIENTRWVDQDVNSHFVIARKPGCSTC